MVSGISKYKNRISYDADRLHCIFFTESQFTWSWSVTDGKGERGDNYVRNASFRLRGFIISKSVFVVPC